MTQSILWDIYHSPTYSSEFNKIRASKTEYVSYDWKPDIRHFIEYDLLPKLQYLKVLETNTADFDEAEVEFVKIIPTTNKNQTQEINEQSDIKKVDIDKYDFGKMTFPDLFKLLTIGQVVSIISALLGLFVIAFSVGAFYNDITVKKSNEDIIEVIEKQSKDIEYLRLQNDSLMHLAYRNSIKDTLE